MEPNIQKIIDELIEIDSSFQEKKKDLKKLISKVIKSKPDFEINPAFIVELKEQLHAKAKTKKQNTFSSLFTMRTFQSFGAGALLTALILTPLFYSMWGKPQSTEELISQKKAFNQTVNMDKAKLFTDGADGYGGLAQNSIMVNSLGKEDFGKLSSQSAKNSNTRNQGANEEILNDTITPMAISESVISSKMIAPYNAVQYKYIFNGEIEINESNITVLRQKNKSSNINTNGLINALNLDLINTSIFKNLSAENISIKENRDFGYTINISNNHGINSLSIYKNWEKWPNPNDNCNDSTCYEKNKLKKKDIPNDAQLIKIANEFTEKLGIDMSPYGKPNINNNYKKYAARDSSDSYIPDEITVTYPIKIKDQEVLDEEGNPTGLNVNIDIRNKKVASLNGLTLQEYDSANYETIDLDNFKAAVERGTYNQNEYYPEDAQIIEIKLGKPKSVLTKIWQWDSKENYSKKLLVPALYFPITEQPKDENYFDKNAIVIPLAKDLYEDNQQPVLYKESVEPMLEIGNE